MKRYWPSAILISVLLGAPTLLLAPPAVPQKIQTRMVLPKTGTGIIKRATGRCGDGIVEGAEECDDGNSSNNDGCSSACAWEVWIASTCGNGICEVNEDIGTCPVGTICSLDPKETSPRCCSLACVEDCCAVGALGVQCLPAPHHTIRCGDAVPDGAEECDDGNTVSGDGCSSICRQERATCGNGVVERWGGENCDDGNATPGDGCDSTCHQEPTRCGNGVVEGWGGEGCDDGNTASGDGCSPSCHVEIPSSSGGGGGGGACSDYFGSCCGLSLTPDCPEGSLRRDYFGFPLCSVCTGTTGVRYFSHASVDGCIRGEDGELDFGANACLNGHCENGACIGMSDSCNDSDAPAGGTSNQGMVTGVRAGVSYQNTDSCVAGDPSRVTEYSCITNPDGSRTMATTVLRCPAGSSCLDGACVLTRIVPDRRLSCDSDAYLGGPGRIIGARGNGSRYILTDYCEADGTTIHTFTCLRDQSYREGTRSCASGEHCEGGLCVTGYLCSRTEATSTVAGYVRGHDGNLQHDLCVLGQLVKFQCDSSGMPIPMEGVTCPAGTTCTNGLCL